MVYGCQVWGKGQGAHVVKIIKLQNHAVRIINFEDLHANARSLYFRKGILKLQDIIKLHNCLLVRNYVNMYYQHALMGTIAN